MGRVARQRDFLHGGGQRLHLKRDIRRYALLAGMLAHGKAKAVRRGRQHKRHAVQPLELTAEAFGDARANPGCPIEGVMDFSLKALITAIRPAAMPLSSMDVVSQISSRISSSRGWLAPIWLIHEVAPARHVQSQVDRFAIDHENTVARMMNEPAFCAIFIEPDFVNLQNK